MRKLNFVLITLIFIPFIFAPQFSGANQIVHIPHIGKVKKIFDSTGKETKFFIPIVEDEFTKNRIVNAQLLRLGKIVQYSNWLETEQDPDVRRHYLFEIGNAFGEEAKWVIKKLIPMLEKEPEENVRIHYISCLSSLAAHAGLNDSEILEILNIIKKKMGNDSSWNVRVHAANILSWYGEDEGIRIIQDILDKNVNILSNILYCIPATLERINNDAAKAILIKITSHSKDDNLKTDAMWRLYKLGLANKDEMLKTAESVAKNSTDEKARIRAISLMHSMAKDNPEDKSRVKNIVENIHEGEKSENVKRFSTEVLETLKK